MSEMMHIHVTNTSLEYWLQELGCLRTNVGIKQCGNANYGYFVIVFHVTYLALQLPNVLCMTSLCCGIHIAYSN